MISEARPNEDEKKLLEYMAEKANDITDFMRRNGLTHLKAGLDISLDVEAKSGTTYDYKNCRAVSYENGEVNRVASMTSNHATGNMDTMVFVYD